MIKKIFLIVIVISLISIMNLQAKEKTAEEKSYIKIERISEEIPTLISGKFEFTEEDYYTKHIFTQNENIDKHHKTADVRVKIKLNSEDFEKWSKLKKRTIDFKVETIQKILQVEIKNKENTESKKINTTDRSKRDEFEFWDEIILFKNIELVPNEELEMDISIWTFNDNGWEKEIFIEPIIEIEGVETNKVKIAETKSLISYQYNPIFFIAQHLVLQ